jgi:hypothetical protein
MSDNRTMSTMSPNDVRMMSPSAVCRRQRIAGPAYSFTSVPSGPKRCPSAVQAAASVKFRQCNFSVASVSLVCSRLVPRGLEQAPILNHYETPIACVVSSLVSAGQARFQLGSSTRVHTSFLGTVSLDVA